jgi:ABC-2 type transport system ATP-binding protein
MSAILIRLVQGNIKVVSFNALDGNLEDIFMKVTASMEESK